VQTVSDANRRIESIVARWPGSVHDSTIFKNSRIRARFENNEFRNYLLLGDAGYAVGRYVLTPIRDPANEAERTYNDAQTQTRKPVECSYGIWKRRFPILSFGINICVSSALSVIIATAILNVIFLQVQSYSSFCDECPLIYSYSVFIIHETTFILKS
jgi:hypothetical protein